MDIQLWLDPNHRLWVFWTQTRDSSYCGNDGRCLSYCDDIFGVWAITTVNLNSDHPCWSKPKRLSDGFLRCRPTVLSNGWWIMGPYDWVSNRYTYSVSIDQGKEWTRHYSVIKSNSGGKWCFDELMIVQRTDDGIWMLARTNEGKLAQTFSYNNGFTWTPVGLSMVESPSSRFWIGRLQSGRMLLINHYKFTERSHLTALLSEDEGQSWPYYLLLDERTNVSYPDAVEYPDGKIAVIYDHERIGVKAAKEILLAQFYEEDA